MAWQAGRWSVNHNGEFGVPSDWGTLIGFSVDMGRGRSQFNYDGAKAVLTFLDGPAWTTYTDTFQDTDNSSDPVARADAVAIRWATPALDAQTKGAPAVFAGQIVEATSTHTPKAAGGYRTVTRVTAEDWLYSAGADRRFEPSGAITATTALLEDLATANRLRAVRLRETAFDSSTVADAAEFAGLTGGELIDEISVAVGMDVWMRHGERLAPVVPPDPDPVVGGFAVVLPPELVYREKGGNSTYDATGIKVTAPDGAESWYTGQPIARRYTVANRAAEVKIEALEIVDEVRLSSSADGIDDEIVSRVSPSTFRRSTFERSSVRQESQNRLQTAAQRIFDTNQQQNRYLSVLLSNLSDAELSAWAGVGIGDEVVMPAGLRLPLIAGGTADDEFIAQVRWVNWQVTPESSQLELGLSWHDSTYTPPPPPPPPNERRARTTLDVGVDGSGNLGWSSVGDASAHYGAFGDETVDLPDGGTARLDSIRWSPSVDRLWIFAHDSAAAAALDGLWLVTDDGGAGGVSGTLRQVGNGRQLRIDPAPTAAPWSRAERRAVEVWDSEPDTRPAVPDQPRLLRTALGIATSGSNRGYQTNAFGTMTDNDFDHGGDTLIIDRFYERTTATDDMRLDFRTDAQATAAVGLWVNASGGIVQQLTTALRNGARFDWDESPDPDWPTHATGVLEVWTIEPPPGNALPAVVDTTPPPPAPAHTATMTTGSWNAWRGFRVGQCGSLAGESFTRDDTAVTIRWVAWQTNGQLRVRAIDGPANVAVEGMWVRIGHHFQGQLTAARRDQYGYLFNTAEPIWEDDGYTVPVEFWETEPPDLPTPLWTAAMTVGEWPGTTDDRRGWSSVADDTDIGSLSDATLAVDGVDITLDRVFVDLDEARFSMRTGSAAQAAALDGKWLRIGSLVIEMTAAAGSEWINQANIVLPTWVGEGTVVTVEVWGQSPASTPPVPRWVGSITVGRAEPIIGQFTYGWHTIHSIGSVTGGTSLTANDGTEVTLRAIEYWQGRLVVQTDPTEDAEHFAETMYAVVDGAVVVVSRNPAASPTELRSAAWTSPGWVVGQVVAVALYDFDPT